MIEEELLPKEWTIAKLDDLIIRMTNGANVTQFDEAVGFPISRIETIWNQTIDFKRVKYIKESDPEFIGKYKLQENDILFSHINSDNHIGKTAIIKNLNGATLIHGINLLLLRATSNVSAEFLNYQLNYLRFSGAFAAAAQKSVNQSSINQVKLRSFVISLPPLAEQHRIVAKIEELFSDLDNGIETLKTAKDQLKVYRQAVLKYAFDGKFNSADDDLIISLRKMSNLGSLFIVGPQNGLYKPSSDYGSGTLIIRIDSFYDGVILNEKSLKRVRLDANEVDKYSLQVDDILINRVNSIEYLGKCGLVKSLSEKTVFESNIMRTRIDQSKALPNYVMYFLVSHSGVKELRKNAKRAVNQASINQTDVSNVIIPIFPIELQHKIIDEIESRLSICDKIEESIEQGIKQAEALRQSILKKAFTGKLVPRDPKDEPAHVLLERIRSERTATQPVKKEKKGKA
jgi:type I restriction enzyme S subunit